MKGIILAGGCGTRLYPLTLVTSKQLLPVYDKPMIYYPLSILMKAGIKDILIISTPTDIPKFKTLLKDGKELGVHFEYCVQEKPNGLAEAFLLGEKFINNEPTALILGDNIFYEKDIDKKLKEAVKHSENGISTIFGYKVKEPERFGVVNFNKDGTITSIEEKPQHPKSNICITGLYFYDKNVVNYAKTIKPSKRNELEITDLNNIYLNKKKLIVEILGEDSIWIDAGTIESLYNANKTIRDIQLNTNSKVADLEEIATSNGWIK